MNKLILAISLVSSLMTKSVAQTTTPAPAVNSQSKQLENLSPEERARKEAQRAEQKLTLNPDQKNKWELAALERVRANQPLKEKMKGSTTQEERKSIQSQMKLNKDKFVTTVVALLTSDQKTKFDQMQKEKETRRQKHDKGFKRVSTE